MGIKLYEKIELVAADAIRPNDWNPNVMTERMYKTLLANIERVGFIEPIIVTKDGVIVNGEHRWRALKDLGIKRIPVVRLEFTAKDPMARLQTIGLNSIHGELSRVKLKPLVVDLSSLRIDLESTGLSDSLLRSLLGDATEDEPMPIKPPRHPQTRTGDLIHMGDHRLLCGSAVEENDMARLMKGSAVDLVLTDPPYNIGIAYATHDDQMSEKEYAKFSERWFTLSEATCSLIVFTPGLVNLATWCAFRRPRWICAWVKHNCMTTSKLGGGLSVWEPVIVFGKPKKKVVRDVYEITLKKQLVGSDELVDLHPTPKQLGLWSSLVGDFSEINDTILDPFGGSGTTLIACERANRKCLMMEMDPAYCDVIVKRWEEYTGKKAERPRRGGRHARS